MKTAEEAGSLNARPEQMRRAWRRARAIARHKRPGLLQALFLKLLFDAFQRVPENLQSQPASVPNQGLTQPNQDNARKQQFVEQQRKLKEISSRGFRAKSKDGRNLVEDFLSKTDLNLSSGTQQKSKAGSQFQKNVPVPKENAQNLKGKLSCTLLCVYLLISIVKRIEPFLWEGTHLGSIGDQSNCYTEEKHIRSKLDLFLKRDWTRALGRSVECCINAKPICT